MGGPSRPAPCPHLRSSWMSGGMPWRRLPPRLRLCSPRSPSRAGGTSAKRFPLRLRTRRERPSGACPSPLGSEPGPPSRLFLARSVWRRGRASSSAPSSANPVPLTSSTSSAGNHCDKPEGSRPDSRRGDSTSRRASALRRAASSAASSASASSCCSSSPAAAARPRRGGSGSGAGSSSGAAPPAAAAAAIPFAPDRRRRADAAALASPRGLPGLAPPPPRPGI